MHNFEHEKLIINKLGTFGQSWQNFEHKCNGSLDQSKTLHIHWSKSQNLNCTWAGIIVTYYGFSLAFQRWWHKKKYKRAVGCFFVLLPDPDCVILNIEWHSFHISIKASKCFLSNGTKNMHIVAAGPELQAVRFRECHFRWKCIKRGGSLKLLADTEESDQNAVWVHHLYLWEPTQKQ